MTDDENNSEVILLAIRSKFEAYQSSNFSSNAKLFDDEEESLAGSAARSSQLASRLFPSKETDTRSDGAYEN